MHKSWAVITTGINKIFATHVVHRTYIYFLFWTKMLEILSKYMF